MAQIVVDSVYTCLGTLWAVSGPIVGGPKNPYRYKCEKCQASYCKYRWTYLASKEGSNKKLSKC